MSGSGKNALYWALAVMAWSVIAVVVLFLLLCAVGFVIEAGAQ